MITDICSSGSMKMCVSTVESLHKNLCYLFIVISWSSKWEVGYSSLSQVWITLRPVCSCRNDDLKEMLESNKESLKLEAMKRIIGVNKRLFTCHHAVVWNHKLWGQRWTESDTGTCSVFIQLIAKGKNASELFPAVVKNVANKNIEVWQFVVWDVNLIFGHFLWNLLKSS